MKKITTLIAGTICAVLAVPVMADSLSGDDIKSTFSGKTAVGDHLKKGMSVKAFHASDGSYISVLSDGTVRRGKWWVDGDNLCVKFDDKGKDKCGSFESDGEGSYKKISSRNGNAVIHFKSLEDGDKTLISPVALSERVNPYSGTWRMKVVKKNGSPRNGTVILNDQDGTWDIDFHSMKHACIGIRSPIVIKKVTADEVVFKIFKSRSLRGCEDYTASLKRVNETTLKGKLSDGRKLTLVRK